MYSKLIAEYYAKYGCFWSKIKCNMDQIFASRSRFLGFFSSQLCVSRTFFWAYRSRLWIYPEVYFDLQRVQFIIIIFSVIVTIWQDSGIDNSIFSPEGKSGANPMGSTWQSFQPNMCMRNQNWTFKNNLEDRPFLKPRKPL